MTISYSNFNSGVLPPYQGPGNDVQSALSTGTYDVTKYAQAYVGGKSKSKKSVKSKSKKSVKSKSKKSVKSKSKKSVKSKSKKSVKSKYTINCKKPKGKIERRFCKSVKNLHK